MKNYFLTLLFFGTIFTSFGENNPTPRKFRFGFRVAPNVGWMHTENKKMQPNGANVGFSYGFMCDYNFNKNLSFSPGIDITTINNGLIFNSPLVYKKTGSTDSTFTGASYSVKNKYFEVPIIFTGKTNEIGYLTYFMQGGVQAGFLMKQKANIKTGPAIDTNVLLNSDESTDYWTSTGDNMSMFRFSMVLGAGAEYNFSGTTSAIIAVRFNNGLNTALKNQTGKTNNNYISLSVGILF